MKKIVNLVVVLCLFSVQLFGQDKPDAGSTYKKRSLIKLNMTSLGFTNFYFQYELTFTKKSSAALGISFMPERGIPGSVVSEDPSNNAANLNFSGWSITPEYRMYFSGHAPKGFYLAPYFRHSKYSTSGYSFTYDRAAGGTGNVYMNGELNANSVGVMIGSQWKFGEHFALDWWIIGAGVGSQEIKLNGTGQFTAADQQDIKDEIDSIDLPLGTMTSDVTSNAVSITYKPGLPGFRGFGVALGYIF